MRSAFSWITIALLLTISGVCLGLKSHWPDLARENGPLENFQALCIVAGTGWCVAAMFRFGLPAQRIFAFGLALLFLTILVLEVDTRRSGVPFLVTAFNGTIRNVWLGSLWILGAAIFCRHARSVLAVFLTWIRTRSGMLLLASAAFWLLGRVSDKALFGSKDLFLEELMEVNAGLLMLLSALYLSRSLKESVAPALQSFAVQPAEEA